MHTCPPNFVLRHLSRTLFLTGWVLALLAGGVHAQDPATKDESKAENAANGAEPLSRLDRMLFNHPAVATHYSNGPVPAAAQVYTLFYPPVPPTFDSELPLLPPLARGVSAPREIAAFVGDWFYPLLASRLESDDLPKNVALQLSSYRATKVALQNALRSKISALNELSPEQREKELALFSTLQTPQITELEALAERIGASLRQKNVLGLPSGIEEAVGVPGQQLRLARNTANLALEASALRNAAFFEEGMSNAQRRLLVVAATELAGHARADPATVQPGKAEWILPFSPDPARIRLIENLPAPLARKISEYSNAKKSMGTELRDTLIAEATEAPSVRTTVFKQLAINQGPRFQELEITAEEIRHDLAALPDPPGPPSAPALPPDLAARISAYRAHKLEILRTLYSLLAPAPLHTNYKDGKITEPAAVSSSWLRDGTTQTNVPSEQTRVPAVEFNAAQTKMLAELNQEQAGIRDALAAHFRTTNQPTDRKFINDLLRDFETARQKQETWEKYRDYQTAVLLPGLSPEQRRLLFDAAIEKLALPLPAGELIKPAPQAAP